MTREIKKSNCHYCGYLCGFDAEVEDGKLVGLEPDPQRYPYDEATAYRCRRWKMNLDEIDGPQRVNYPMKRVGERGSATFERVSWDEALDDIAKRLQDLKDRYGPQTLASAIGGPHATFWPLHRFLSLYGTPNNMGIGQICWNPRILFDGLTYGWPMEVDINMDETGCVVLWATNPAESDNSLFWQMLKQLRQNDIPLVVVDPRTTKTARIADYHLAPFPGTDAYLALALVAEVIAAGLEDRDFIDEWCHGFEELKQHIAPYTAQVAQRETGIPAEDIRAVARLFATAKASSLLSGRGIDQLGPNTAPIHRALSILRAITGNIDRPGACTIMEMSDFVPEVELEMSNRLTPEQRATQLNIGHCALQSYPGYEGADELTGRFDKHLPMRYLTSAHPGLVFDAMITGDPYPVKALIVMAANPVVTYANTQKVIEGLMNLDLLVVLEYYMTPTAQLADYVLPSAGAFERPLFQAHGGVSNFAYGGAAAVKPYHERKSDYEIIRGLAVLMGQEDDWPDATLEQAYDRTLQRAGLTFEQFAQKGLYAKPLNYFKHYATDPETDEPQGFCTSTHKIELKNEYLIKLGAEEFPTPVPECIARPQLENGIAVMMTGARFQPYWASSYFNNPEFRKLHPEPLVSMAPATAQALGVQADDWVRLSNEHGSAVLKVAYDEMPVGVVSAEYGWWYPEEQEGLPDLSGSLRSNVNMLTSNAIEDCEPMVGSWTYNGLAVHVGKTDAPFTEAQ